MNLPVRKVAIILYKDDVEGLKRTIEHIKPYFNTIIVGSDDPLVLNIPNVIIRDTTVNIFGFAQARNKLDAYVKDYQIHVHIDTDEVWDTAILADLTSMVIEKKPVWRSRRCNMPHGRNYPDWQTRAFWYVPEVHWVGDVHEIVYRGDKPYDQWVDVGTFERPIIHLPRKIDLRRPWWETT